MRLFFGLSPCPICKNQPSTALGCCKSCQKDLFKPLKNADSLALGPYRDKLELAIRHLKYHHVTGLAKLFAQELAKEIRRANWSADYVTAVPLHWKRYLSRGYNQSALVAKPLAHQLGIAYAPLLSRTQSTQQQAKLSKLEREKNVANAFKAKPVEGKRILLLDDVITTGATLRACQTCLYEAGAKEVKLVAIARAVQRLS